MPPTDGPEPTTPAAAASNPPEPYQAHAPPPIRAVLIGLLIGLVSAGAGIAVGAVTLPTSEEIQRATVEELGLDPDLLDHPLVEPMLDEVSDRAEDRVVDEARESVVAAVGTAVGVAAAGVALVALAARRDVGQRA